MTARSGVGSSGPLVPDRSSRPPGLSGPSEPHGNLRDDSGGGGGWHLLTTAKDGFVARLIEGLLAEEGIDVFLDDHNPAPGAFLKPFGDPLAPVKVFVRQHDFSKASLILHEVDHQPPDPMALGPRRVKMLWIATVSAALGASVLMLLEILGFAPCLLNLFCL